MKFDITKACQDRMNLVVNMRALVDAAGDQPLSSEDQAKFTRMRDDEEALKVRIDQEEELRQKEREVSKIKADRPFLPNLESEDEQKRAADLQRVGFLNWIKEPDANKRSERDSVGIREFVHSSNERRALQKDSKSAGGFLVPKQFATELIKDADNSTFVLGDARVFPLNKADSIEFPVLNSRFGALQMVAEIGEATADTTLDFGQRMLQPKYGRLRIRTSRSLLRNSMLDVDAIIRSEMSYSTGIGMEQYFLTGIGGPQPLGFMVNSVLGVPTSRNVSAGNTTTVISADNLREVKYSVKSSYDPAWYGHRDWVRRVSLMKDGNQQYLWTPGIREGDSDTLLGDPVRQSEYAPNTFTAGLVAAAYADLSRYYVLIALDMEMLVSEHTRIATNEVEYFLFVEFDGSPVRSEAFALSVMAP